MTRGGKIATTHLWLNDLQVPHLDPTRREIWDLELDVDGTLALANLRCAAHAASKSTCHAPTVLVVALDGGQTELGTHEELLTATELLDFPNDGGFLRRVVNGPNVGPESRGVSVLWDRNKDLNIVGSAPALKLGFGLYDR